MDRPPRRLVAFAVFLTVTQVGCELRPRPPATVAEAQGAPFGETDTVRPVVDHHQHLVSRAGAAAQDLAYPSPAGQPTISAADLIALLDDAGIQRAVVLSVAFWFDSRRDEPSAQSYAKVRAENDWAAAQIAKYPRRLVGFCSFNPLREHALAELERCARTPHFIGVKLHFDASGVNLGNPTHLASVQKVFAEANSRRLAIIVHVRADRSYGREHAEIFLDRVLPMAPDVVVQIAHLWGGGTYSESALARYADAVASREPATKNLYFDVTDAALVAERSPRILNAIATRIRQIGPRRVLYGSDAVDAAHPPPREAWAAFRTRVPLTDEEFGSSPATWLPISDSERISEIPFGTGARILVAHRTQLAHPLGVATRRLPE